MNQQKPKIIAHRGARDEAPENTRSAFERALAYPIDGIELDVQMTADGLPVVIHDRTPYRLAGIRRRVASLTYDELKQFDFGRRFHVSFANERLLTLDQALSTFGHRTSLLIEIKSRLKEQLSGTSYELTKKVMELVSWNRNSATHNRHFILSFDIKVLSMAREISPDIAFVLNVPEERPSAIMDASPHMFEFLWAVNVKISRLTSEFVRWARANSLQVFTYTCNGPKQVHKALQLSVDAILTDRPGWLASFLKGS